MTVIRLVGLAVALAATPALAQPEISQHPRLGQLAELTFEPGSAELRVGLDNKLGQIAAWAKENPEGHVVLDGHADERGPMAANVRLSLERAQAVRRQLVMLGIDPEQIVLVAYGETVPRGESRPGRRVVVWGTRSGLNAIVARTMARRGDAVIWTGAADAALEPRPEAVAPIKEDT